MCTYTHGYVSPQQKIFVNHHKKLIKKKIIKHGITKEKQEGIRE